MFLGKKIVVVMPAYNAAKTLRRTYDEVMAQNVVDLEGREILEQVPYKGNSDDFVFDNQMLAQIIWYGHFVAEVSCPTKYFPEASSIGFWRSVRYGCGCLTTGVRFRLARWGVIKSSFFPIHGHF